MFGIGLGIWSGAMRGPQGPGGVQKYIQTDYDAEGDGVTNDNSAFSAFATEYNDSEVPVTLNLETGSYLTSGLTGNWFGQYIPNLTVKGPAPVGDTWAASFVSGVRVGGSGQLNDNDHSVRLEAVSANSTVVTVKDDDISGADRTLAELVGLFPVDSYVAVTSYDLQGYGFPSNQQNVEIRKVVSVNTGTGEITLDSALEYAYSDTAPVYNSGEISGVDHGGPATMYVFNSYFDRDVTFENVEWLPGTNTYMAGRSITLKNCKTDDIGPGNAVEILIDGGVHDKFEVDKLCEQITVQDAEIDGIGVQSASPNLLNVTGSTIRLFDGTAKETVIDDCEITERLIIGPTAYGAGGPVTLTNSVLPDDIRMSTGGNSLSGHELEGSTIRGLKIAYYASQTGTPVVSETLTGGTSGATATITEVDGSAMYLDVSTLTGAFEPDETASTPSSSGTISTNRFGREWAVPGALLMFRNEDGVAGSATCTGISRDEDGVNEIATDLTDAHDYMGTLVSAFPHPCTNFTASGNTGSDMATVLNTHVAGEPFGTTARIWVGSDGVLRGGGHLYGKVTGVTVNVTKAYTGTEPDLFWTLHRFDNFTGTDTDTGTERGFDPQFDLTQTGIRTWTPEGNSGQVGDDDTTEDCSIFFGRELDITNTNMGYYDGSSLVDISGESLSVHPEFTMTITVDPAWSPEVEAATSRTIGYYPMDEASGDFYNALYADAYLARDASVTQQVEPNGLVLARTGDNNSVDAIIGNSADGLVLTGGETWCVHGFFRWRRKFNWRNSLKSGGNPHPVFGGPDFRQADSSGTLRLTIYDGVDGVTPTDTDFTITNDQTTLHYVAFGWDGEDAFVKVSTDGVAWSTETTVLTSQQMETAPHLTVISDAGAAIDIGQICITRDIPSEADLTWFANGMEGRETSEVTDRLGAWPEPQSLPATIQTDGGTTWDDETLLTHTGWLKNDASVAGDLYWCKPYDLRSMDSSLADTHGEYVWFMSSDHSGGGIVMGFSDALDTPPASWERIWAAGVSGEPGQTNADIDGFHASSETPCLVYNPDDVEGRPFWLYYHDLGRSIAQNDASTGYSAPQETRLITSGTLVRGSWQYKQTVLPVRNYGTNQVLNHRGYASVYRNGTGDWEVWHLGSDNWTHSFARSTSTDGLTWELDWFDEDAYYRRWERQQNCPPGWRMGSPLDVFTFSGQRYALGIMDVASKHANDGWASFRDPDQRYVYIAPLGSDGLTPGAPIILYDSNGPYYDADNASYDDPELIAPHDGYIQSVKSHLDGSTLHLYIKHRFKPPTYMVHATVDLSPLV